MQNTQFVVENKFVIDSIVQWQYNPIIGRSYQTGTAVPDGAAGPADAPADRNGKKRNDWIKTMKGESI